MILPLPGARDRGHRRGASGTLTTIYLLRDAAARRLPLRIALIDQNGRHGEVYRHRVPPETARRIAALRSAGRLTVHRGGVGVRIDHGASATDLTTGWLINCTGPATDTTTTADPSGATS